MTLEGDIILGNNQRMANSPAPKTQELTKGGGEGEGLADDFSPQGHLSDLGSAGPGEDDKPCV